MKNSKWTMGWGAALALYVLGGAPVRAERVLGHPEQVPQTARVVESRGASGSRLETLSARELEQGAWMFVQPGEDGASWPWELVTVEAVGQRSLELSRPLRGPGRSTDTQVHLLAVSQVPPGSATAWLDSPMQDARVSGDSLSVRGRAPQDSQVIIVVDGVEGARLEVDESGRFEGALEVPLAAGSHQVQVVSGGEGTWSLQPETLTVTSLAPPSAPVLVKPESGFYGIYINTQTPLFQGRADPGNTVFITVSGAALGSAPVDASGNWSFQVASPLAEKTHTLTLRAQASTGESTSSSVEFTVDITPPTSGFSQYPPKRTRSTSATFAFSSPSDVETPDCSLDGEPFKRCDSPYIITGLSEGTHALRARSTDLAGNVEPVPAQYQWFVDLTPPTVTYTQAPPARTNEVVVHFWFSTSEESTAYTCFLDGASVAAGTCRPENMVLGTPEEGEHRVEVSATDVVGNVGPKAVYVWTTDLTAPPEPVLQRPEANTLLNSPTPEIAGTGEPDSQVKVILNGTQIGSATVGANGTWSFRPPSALTSGAYELTLEAQDQAGNTSSQSAPVSFNLDVDVPDTIIAAGPAAISDVANPKFALQSTEPGVVYECRVGQEPFGPCDALVAGTRSFAPGQYTVEVRAKDAAGNVDETPATLTWTYNPLQSGGGGGGSGCSATGAVPLLPLVPLLAFLKRRRQRSALREVGGGLLALLTGFLAGPARAQGVDVQPYKPAPGARDVLGVYSAEIPRPAEDAKVVGHGGLSLNYAHNPLVLRTADGSFAQSVVSSQLTADVLASVSAFDHLELGVAIPITYQTGAEAGSLNGLIPENTQGLGVGDIRGVLKGSLPLKGPLQLGGAAVVSLPTASQGFFGTGAFGFQPMLLGQWAFNERLRVLGNVGWRFRPDSEVEQLKLNQSGNALTYALGAQWAPADSGLFFQGSLEGAALGNQSDASPLELKAALGYSLTKGLALKVGGGPGLTSGYGTPNFRVFASLDWTSPTGDEPPRICKGKSGEDDDKDGVQNQRDQCPFVEGDLENDGCPRDEAAGNLARLLNQLKEDNSDGDGDGIRKFADACPEEAEGTLNDILDKDGCPEELSEPIRVKLTFAAAGTSVEPTKETQKVIEGMKNLPEGRRLVKVMAIFPEGELMQARFESARKLLNPQKEQKDPKVSEDISVEPKFSKDISVTHSTGRKPKDSFEAQFVIVTTSAKAKEQKSKPSKCAEAGRVAAQVLWLQGTVTAGSENKQLASNEQVCVGERVRTGNEARAVLVLSDGHVLRLAPDSQVTLDKDSSDVKLNGMAELEGRDKDLKAPEVDVPCTGPVVSSPSVLAWKSVDKAQGYVVLLSSGPGFNANLRFVPVTGGSTKVSLESLNLLKDSNKWYWRVLPVNKEGFAGPASKTHYFEVSAPDHRS